MALSTNTPASDRIREDLDHPSHETRRVDLRSWMLLPLSEHDAILHRLRRALFHVRCRRMHGVSDEQHAPLVPG
jgi:hypothetical protein